MNNKILIAMIIVGAIVIVSLAHMVVNSIRQDGLKSITEQIWCGEKGCE